MKLVLTNGQLIMPFLRCIDKFVNKKVVFANKNADHWVRRPWLHAHKSPDDQRFPASLELAARNLNQGQRIGHRGIGIINFEICAHR